MLQKTTSVPETIKEVAREHGQIARHIRAIIRTKTRLAARVQALTAKAGGKIAEHRDEALLKGQGIFDFAAAHRTDLLTGKEKLVALPRGGSIEWEDTSPSLEIGNEKRAVALLRRLKLDDCINENPTVNKTALKAKLKKNPELLQKLKGFKLRGNEMFRIRFGGLAERVECAVDKPHEMDIVTPRQKKAAVPTQR